MSSVEMLNSVESPQKTANISGVEMFGIINKQGRMIDFWGKKSLSLTRERRDMFLMQIVLQNSMQKDFDEEFGNVSHCTTYRGNAKFIHFPYSEEKTVLIVASKRANDVTIIERVRAFLCSPKMPQCNKGGTTK